MFVKPESIPLFGTKVDTIINETSLVVNNKHQAVHQLYDKYAGMLLGYIMEVVKDRAVAEQYLISVFNDIANHLDEFLPVSTGTFCRLQLFARKKLSSFFEKKSHIPAGIPIQLPDNKFHSLLSDEHNHVFCGLHYHGKTTAMLAQELNKPEATVRGILKEAFSIIRKGHQV